MHPLRRLRAVASAAALVTLSATLLAGQPAGALQQVPGANVPAPLPSSGTVGGLKVENSFVSHLGWVKPGEAYPSRFLVSNANASARSFSVSLPETKGMLWTRASAALGTVALKGGVVTWKVPSLDSGARAVLILEATAETTAQEPTVVWRNISSRGTVTTGGSTAVFASHGPKVIPPAGGYETARYGDRPFPVVPVDYTDFQHTRSSAKLDNTINGKSNPASTFNLYQEISYGQLFPNATIPSVKLKNKSYSTDPAPLHFSTINAATTNTCTGATLVNPLNGEPSPLYTSRIKDGWYQLPGMRSYYGSDANGSAVVGSLTGVAALQNIDGGCGPTAKLAYDAAVVADPDIDYSDYDTDKDGVVDFFEVIFEGCGGNGESQLNTDNAKCNGVAYDNVWPHSSTLESTYTDPVTGLSGYVSKDQLKDYEGHPLWYTDTTYKKHTTKNMGNALKVFVRVGPYNVNPETAIDYASVISHEYGHSLGLPDYYSTGSRETYGDWMIMATDKSQNMDVIGKKELGWVVPEVLPTGVTKVKNWHDTKRDTGAIHWVTPKGKPYTLSDRNGDFGIHNGQAYYAALPGRKLLDPKLITANGGKQVWYSGQGNDFGCAPRSGHNLDLAIPGLADLPAGTKVNLSFKSLWSIEWDFDYGFVMTGTPDSHGTYTYKSLASANNYTTPSVLNPNQNGCQQTYGNGLTGTSTSAKAGTATVDRVAGTYDTPEFVDDSYDVSSLAGVKGGTIRFSYSTDPGTAKLGWIIDNLKVTATVNGAQKVVYSSGFEGKDAGNDPVVYPGGCKEDLTVDGGLCTTGFQLLTAGAPAEAEHAYLLEMRDRSGFDFDGRGQNDRDAIGFQPGVLLDYTDEAHGYGNAGTDDPPAQSPLDATPTQKSETPNLNDASFTEARASYSDSKAKPHYDNYTQPGTGGAEPWTFAYDCLKLHVDSMSGDTGNAASKYDLVGNVTFTTGGGCATFNYGYTSNAEVARPIGGPGLPVDVPSPVAAGGGKPGLAATGGLGAPVLALMVLLGSAVLVRRVRRTG
ncbi:MAG: domain containing protein [Frankiales bacterium]|nr:domain containing protein [Frankiales bacterium]